MIILYTSISIVVLAFILCLIIKLNNNRKENIKNTVKQAFWNDCNKHSLLLFHLMVDKLNVQESDLPKKNYELTDEAMFQAIHEYQHVLKNMAVLMIHNLPRRLHPRMLSNSILLPAFY